MNHQKEYWEKGRKRRSPTHPVVKAFTEQKISFIRKVLSPHETKHGKNWTLLDVGCGNGYFSYYWEQLYQTTCLDYSVYMLSINPCEKRICGLAESLPFKNDSFDIVFCSNLLHHLKNPVEAVGEMKRVSKKFVVLSEPNGSNPFMFLFGLIKKEERGTLKFSAKYVKNIIEKNKLNLLSIATMGSVVPNKLPTFLLPVMDILNNNINFGLYHVVVGAK